MFVHKTYRPHLTGAPDARAVRSRHALREAMLALLEKKGFENLTIGDVAAQAGVGYSTVCRHYPTLEALMDDVAATEISRVIEQTFSSFETADPGKAVMALLTHVHSHRAAWSAMLLGGAAPALKRAFLQLTQSLADAWDGPDTWLPRDLGATMAVGSTLELLTWWVRQDDPPPVETMAGIYLRMVVEPMVGPALVPAAVPITSERGAPSGRRTPRSRRAAK